MTGSILENFKQIGFNVYEARVYVEMLKGTTPLTAYEIGKLSGVPRSKVYEVVDNLYKKQIIMKMGENPKKYLPVDPEEVFANIEKSFLSCVNSVKEELNHLDKGETIDYIFNIFGKEAIVGRSRDMIRSAASSILIAIDRGMLDILETDLKEAEKRDVELNIVFYGDKEEIGFTNVYSHRLREPDIQNFSFILLDTDFKEVLAGTMSRRANEGHGFWTKSVYLSNIMQDNIIHEISLGMLEEKLGLNHIHELTDHIPHRIWEKAMALFNSKFHIRL
jgi:sugar-specific transcriptional regulator TrmB